MAAQGAAPGAVRYVATAAINAAVKGRESEILDHLEIAWRNGWIDDAALLNLAEPLAASGYGQYLRGLVAEAAR